MAFALFGGLVISGALISAGVASGLDRVASALDRVAEAIRIFSYQRNLKQGE